MKLILQRNQTKGFSGKTTFSVTATVEVSNEEKANINKYKLGKELLYTNMEDRGSGVLGAISRKMMAVEFTINNLINGKKIDCKTILEMLELEESIMEVTKTFKQVLDASATFGDEEVIEL